MAFTIMIHYTGESEAVRAFAKEMVCKGIVDRIRAQEGNLAYEYYWPHEQEGHLLLIDRWENQAALDRHHASPMMAEIAALRETYDLHMRVERFVADDMTPKTDTAFIRD